MTRGRCCRRVHGAVLALALCGVDLGAWGAQGHRVIGAVAERRLTTAARQQVARLLDGASLADVATWADQQIDSHAQTSGWHFVNIRPGATSYDRLRDCPVQPGVTTGSFRDRWRDCVVDRIRYVQARLSDRSLDRIDRGTALKFLVHLVADVHQPFHAISTDRGGNGIPVSVFGSPGCRPDDAASSPCNLHLVWDTVLIARRGRPDREYVAELERLLVQRGWTTSAPGSPAEWAMESHAIARGALVPARTDIDDSYARAHLPEVDERLARAGVRLAAAINGALGDR